MIEINSIYNMDCVKGMQLLENESIDLVVTSPPYDNLRRYKGYDFNFEACAKELVRVIKKGGVIVWVCGDQIIDGSESGTSFKHALFFKELGLRIHDTMIYQKDGTQFPDSTRYYQVFEYMFILSKGRPKTINLIDDRENLTTTPKKKMIKRNYDGDLIIQNRRNPIYKKYGVRTNIWRIPRGYNKSTCDKIAYKHPAIFPEKLAYDHILSWSNKYDLVLDPFLGSGTTAKMALLSNRNYIGFDASLEYCKIAEERLRQAKEYKEVEVD